MVKAIFAIMLVLVPPELRVRWLTADTDHGLVLQIEEQEANVDQCLDAGLELRYRFDFQLCEERSYWFDACGREGSEVRSLEFDPISESHRLTIDRFDDGNIPSVLSAGSREKGLALARRSDEISLQFLSRNMTGERADNVPRYVRARVITDCRGDTGKTLRRLSYILSLGMIRTAGFDSGWIRFDLSAP